MDPKYIKPIVQIAGLAGRQQHWQEELDVARQALALHPVNFPGAYFYFAEAQYHLGRAEDAAQSLHTAIECDPGGEFPQAHFLAGTLLAQSRRTSEAVQEFQIYLQLSPRGQFAAGSKRRIVDLTRLPAP